MSGSLSLPGKAGCGQCKNHAGIAFQTFGNRRRDMAGIRRVLKWRKMKGFYV